MTHMFYLTTYRSQPKALHHHLLFLITNSHITIIQHSHLHQAKISQEIYKKEKFKFGLENFYPHNSRIVY